MSSTRIETSTNRGPKLRHVRRGVLLRYRVMAYVTGVLLIPLVFVATPLKFWGHVSAPAAILGSLHGWLYMIYLVTAFVLTVQLKYPLGRMLLVLLAGTVPFCSFIAERKVTKAWEANEAAARAAGGASGPGAGFGGSGTASGRAGRDGDSGPNER